jgi:hypothetical protein
MTTHADSTDATGPSPAADPDVPSPDNAAGEGDEDDTDPAELDENEVKNHRLKQLSDEAAKWRRKFRQANERAEKLEATATDDALREENRTLHLRLAWERATTNARLRDADAAWTLGQEELKSVEVTEGQVDTARIGEIVSTVVTRYPYLVEPEDEPASPSTPSDVFPDLPKSGKRTDGKRPVNTDQANRSALEQRFPALRGR